ncbi:unnamed protein product [Vitrella brassicaformis CCMP3155]|uniref:Uncharacterized protein n=1 Tax=Vitrella brassicaformis (strain CCMP3155) TaxID=1169540 RepID=A0A0G4EFH9_VITBC|nr:unnamed protein product [Vitrella brassicaformis CCMP3155]|eukprot:CEL94187.1 unnamed protein product [Vitrella brassicaformis CCMP3155]
MSVWVCCKRRHPAAKQGRKPSAVVLAMVFDPVFRNDLKLSRVRRQIDGLVKRLHTMVAEEGTTAVLVPQNGPVPFVEAFLRKCGLPWERSEYERTSFYRTRRASRSCSLQAINNKCCSLKDVPEAHRMYVSTDESVTTSLVWAPRPTEPGLVGVACAKVGKGKVIYVGDVNAEESSIQVIADLLKQG